MSNINELFSRDPMNLTDDDIDSIILEMRNKRHLFNANPAAAAARKPLTEREKSTSGLKIELEL